VLIGNISSYCRSGDESSKKSKWRRGRFGLTDTSTSCLYLNQGSRNNGQLECPGPLFARPSMYGICGCMDILVTSPRTRIRTQIYSLGPHFLRRPPKGGLSCTASLTSSSKGAVFAGQSPVSTLSAAWQKPLLPTSSFGLIRPNTVSGPSDAPITTNPTDSGAVEMPMRSQNAAIFDSSVRLCLLTYHHNPHLVRVMWGTPHLLSSFMLLVRFLLRSKRWTMWTCGAKAVPK
jgi:hypothetical protein